MMIVEQRVIPKYLSRNKYEKNFMFDFSGTNVVLSPLKQLRPMLIPILSYIISKGGVHHGTQTAKSI